MVVVAWDEKNKNKQKTTNSGLQRTRFTGSSSGQTKLILSRCADEAADGNKSTDLIRAQWGPHSGSDCGTAESLNHSPEDRVSC